MVAQLKLELPPLPPRPLDLPIRGFASSSSPFTPCNGPVSSAESPCGVLSLGERGWLGGDTSGGRRAALLMLSRCLKEGLMSSAAASPTGGVAYMIRQMYHNRKKKEERKQEKKKENEQAGVLCCCHNIEMMKNEKREDL